MGDNANMYRKGVLTIEAALVLPLFLSAMLLIACLMNITWLNMKIGSALAGVGNEMSAFAYSASAADEAITGIRQAGNSCDEETIMPAGGMISQLYLKTKIDSILGGDLLVKEMVRGGTSGISFLNSSLMEDGQTIDIAAEYEVVLPFSGFGLPGIHYQQRVLLHGWVGYIKEDSNGDKDNPVVFVTDTGTVYHRSRDCAYLHLSVSTVNGDAVKNLRSEDGSIYYPCELCHAPGVLSSADTVYLTEDGNRYHVSRECSGIKRNIHEIPLSEVGGRGPCSKCGGQ